MSETGGAVQVRHVRAGEGALLRELRLRALAEAPHAFTTTHADAAARPEQWWHDAAAASEQGLDRRTFIAECDGHWAGMTGTFIHENDPVPEIISVWVERAARGTGAGEALIAAACAWARAKGATAIRLEVRTHNAPAIALYRRLGFTEAGTSGLNLIMQKELA